MHSSSMRSRMINSSRATGAVAVLFYVLLASGCQSPSAPTPAASPKPAGTGPTPQVSGPPGLSCPAPITASSTGAATTPISFPTPVGDRRPAAHRGGVHAVVRIGIRGGLDDRRMRGDGCLESTVVVLVCGHRDCAAASAAVAVHGLWRQRHRQAR